MKAPIHDLHPGNLLTYGSLAAALAAVAVSGAAGAPAAGGWLALAAFLDTFDGRFARCFERTSRQRRIGCEIDSLVDVCAFGMGPVVVLEAVSPPGSGLLAAVWWASAFAYVGAVVTRLGFYHVEADDERFVGIRPPRRRWFAPPTSSRRIRRRPGSCPRCSPDAAWRWSRRWPSRDRGRPA